MRKPDARAARGFRIIADIALMVGILGLTMLIIAWQQHWPNAIAWVAPALIGGVITVIARVMHHRYTNQLEPHTVNR